MQTDIATLRERAILGALEELDRRCMQCDYDEAEGGLISHCDKCCRKIVAELGKVRRVLARSLSKARDAARKPAQRSRYYARTHRGGTIA